MYRALRPIIFRADSEKAHDTLMRAAEVVDQVPYFHQAVGTLYRYDHPKLNVEIAGLRLPNPVMLAAGFDKNCRAVGLLSSLGFGAIEIGSVTAQPQEGNPKPRIFRFPRDHALINRMGFPSDGAEIVAQRLQKVRLKYPKLVLGINIGKSKVTPIEQALEDYAFTFVRVVPYADYVAINVSSPNTPGLRALQDRDKLEELLGGLQNLNTGRKPLFLKISPDLGTEQLNEVVECCQRHGISAIIATNTTITRDGLSDQTEEIGGLSGAPLFRRSLAVVQQLSKLTRGSIPIIAAGGISGASEARQMLQSGATAIQIYTSLIYSGPAIVKVIKRGLAADS